MHRSIELLSNLFLGQLCFLTRKIGLRRDCSPHHYKPRASRRNASFPEHKKMSPLYMCRTVFFPRSFDHDLISVIGCVNDIHHTTNNKFSARLYGRGRSVLHDLSLSLSLYRTHTRAGAPLSFSLLLRDENKSFVTRQQAPFLEYIARHIYVRVFSAQGNGPGFPTRTGRRKNRLRTSLLQLLALLLLLLLPTPSTGRASKLRRRVSLGKPATVTTRTRTARNNWRSGSLGS